MSALEKLYEKVTVAIGELAENNRNISHLEEEIAKLTSPYSKEGRIARCGAVSAAVKSGDDERAEELVNRFLLEDGIDANLSDKLRALLS